MTDSPARHRQVLDELAPLTSLALATGHARTSSEAASSALEILTHATGASAGLILFNSGEGYDAGAYRGLPAAHVRFISQFRRAGSRLTEALEATEHPIDAAIDNAPFRTEIADALRADGIGHVLLVGLRAEGRLIGLLGLGWPSAPSRRPDDAILLQAAALIAVSVENTRLVERLERSLQSERRLVERLERSLLSERRLVDEQTALQSLTLLGERAGGLEELAAATIQQVQDLLGGVAATYALVTPDDRVVHAAHLGVDDSFVTSPRDGAASSMPSVKRLLHGEGPYVQDAVAGAIGPTALARLMERGFESWASIPVRIERRLEAIIVVYFDHPARELADATRVLEVISRIAGISLAKFRLREGLLASEERYRILFEESPDPILLLTLDSVPVAANRAALELYNTNFETLKAFMATGAGRQSAIERRRRLEIVQREGHGTFRDTGVRPDGSSFPEEIQVARVEIGGDGRYMVLIRDLTDQQRLQQELLQAQKMEAIGQLVSGVAHELNNPLAAIVAFSQHIFRDQRLPADLRDDAGLLVKEADRTRRIVQNLLDFARQRPKERLPTAIPALVESVLALQSYSISAGRIEIAMDLPDDLPEIDADRGQLQQVVLNLTLNAIQAIRANQPSGHIWISGQALPGPAGQGSIRLSISDDGPGIPVHLRSRLFLPFFSTKEPGQGTGLGLSVSFGIVAAHGGSLRFEPGSGGRTPPDDTRPGATFIIELPAHADETLAADAVERRYVPRFAVPSPPPRRVRGRAPGTAGSPERASSRAAATTDRARRPRTRTAVPATTAVETAAATPTAPRILVLDDEPSIRRLLARTLRQGGFDPVLAVDGPEAIRFCEGGSFDALLVDHRMPGMSGTDVYNAVVGAQPELARRFIFMSGDVLNPELDEFARARYVALLPKPFDIDALIRVVGEVVRVPAG